MENLVEFITSLDHFFEVIKSVVSSEATQGILISGTFDNVLYKNLLDELINGENIKHCKIIIPFVSKSGIISRPYLNRIIGSGGELRTNSKFTNNILVVGKYAFVLSFTSKYSKEYGLRTSFESCMVTTNRDVVNKIHKEFMSRWERSLAIINGV